MEVSITLEKAYYFPGELLKCLVKVRWEHEQNTLTPVLQQLPIPATGACCEAAAHSGRSVY
jgi:hypothetical protein